MRCVRLGEPEKNPLQSWSEQESAELYVESLEKKKQLFCNFLSNNNEKSNNNNKFYNIYDNNG